MEPGSEPDQGDSAEMTPLSAPPRRWSKLKVFLTILIFSPALCVLAYVAENFRGQWAWNAFQEEWEARGEKFDYRQWIPTPIPSEKNFAHSPLLKPLFETEYDEDFGTFTPAEPEKHQRSRRLFDDLRQLEDTPNESWESGQRVDLAGFQESFRKGASPRKPGEFDKSIKKLMEDNGISTDDKSEPPPRVWPRPAKPGKPAEDVLQALGVFAEDMAALTRAAKERPLCRFDVNYEALLSAEIPHVMVLHNAIYCYSLRALAHLAADDTEAAFSDVEMGFFLTDCMSSEPMLISQMMRTSSLPVVLQAVWEGLAIQKWNADQLATLEKRLAGINLLQNLHRAQLCERDMLNAYLEKIREDGDIDPFNPAILDESWWQPTGWFDQNQLRYNAHYMRFHRRIIDLETRTIQPSVAVEQEKFFSEMSQIHPYNIITSIAVVALSSAVPPFGDGQTKIDLARIACLIELHKLRKGKYPSELAELQPPLPADPYSGNPYLYSAAPGPEAIERYQLYGVGWNQEDDGGRIFLDEDGHTEPRKGDLVWRYSPVPTFPGIQQVEEK